MRLLSVSVLFVVGCGPQGFQTPINILPCESTCEAAWACGGVLENDLAGCVERCDDTQHVRYRDCIARASCEVAPECKVFGP